MTTHLQTIITHLQGQINTALPGVPVGFSEEAAFVGSAPRAVVILPLSVVPDDAAATLGGQGHEARFALVLLARGPGALALVEAMDEVLFPALATPAAGCIDVLWQGDEYEFSNEAAGLIVAKRSAFVYRYPLPRWHRS